jgi:hypothetical protein
MENSYQTNDVLDPHRPKKLPGMLNVLTILTFIGCGLGYIGSCWTYISSTAEKIAEAQEKRAQLPDSGFAAKMLDDSIKMAQINYENKTLILITNLIFITLCLIGALQMRKLKKSGYFIYVIGELAPVVLLVGLIGGFTGFGVWISVFFSLLFVILYGTQLKYLESK